MSEKFSWRSGYIVTIVLFIALLIGYIDRMNISILIANKEFLQDMGIVNRPDLQGMLMTIFLWAYGITSILLSFVLDRLGARRGLLILATIWSIAMWIGGAARSFVQMIISRILLGFGEGLQFPLNSLVVKTWAPPRERGMANSIWSSGMYVGSAIGMPLVVFLITSMGWRASFFVLGLATFFISIPLTYIFVYNRPQDSPRVTPEELAYIEQGLALEKSQGTSGAAIVSKSDWGNLLHNSNFWILVVAFTAQNCGFWGFVSWVPSYLKVSRGFSWAAMSGFSALPYMFALVAILISGYLMFRIQNKTIFMCIGNLIYAISIFLALYTENNVISAIWLSTALGGLGFTYSAVYTTLHKLVAAKVTGMATGLMNGLASLLSGAVPYLMGWIMAIYNGSYSVGFAFLVITSAFAVVTYLLLYVRECKKSGNWLDQPVTGVNAAK